MYTASRSRSQIWIYIHKLQIIARRRPKTEWTAKRCRIADKHCRQKILFHLHFPSLGTLHFLSLFLWIRKTTEELLRNVSLITKPEKLTQKIWIFNFQRKLRAKDMRFELRNFSIASMLSYRIDVMCQHLFPQIGRVVTIASMASERYAAKIKVTTEIEIIFRNIFRTSWYIFFLKSRCNAQKFKNTKN